MKDTAKKIAYLKGLIDPMEDSLQAKALKGILEVLSALDDSMDSFEDKLADLNDYVESIDDDLSAMEDGEYDDEDFDDEDYDEDFDEEDFEIARRDRVDKVHVVHITPDGDEMLNGRLCTNCKRLFMTSVDDDPKAEYICPFCATRMRPEDVTIKNAPAVSPVE